MIVSPAAAGEAGIPAPLEKAGRMQREGGAARPPASHATRLGTPVTVLRPPPRDAAGIATRPFGGGPLGRGYVADAPVDPSPGLGAYASAPTPGMLIAQGLPFEPILPAQPGLPYPPDPPFPAEGRLPFVMPVGPRHPPRCPLIIEVGRGLAAPARSRIVSGRPNCL